jgi:triacylglycerol esterase/lipase EstA (alpha/beta hydrolase family)
MRELDNRPKEHWALLSRVSPNVKLAIFVHGFYGNYLSTWGKIPDLIHTYADTDAVCAEWDFLFVGYNTNTVDTYLDIAAVLSTQWQKARQGSAPFTQAYEQVALFGHSLGTLGIRQLLCARSAQPDGHLNDLKTVVLFGTPLNGSGWARLAILTKVADALKKGNPQLRMLKTWSTDAHAQLNWPQVRIVLGLDDKVVGAKMPELIQWSGDISPADVTNFDHSHLVKPTSWQSAVINYIQNALR